jgi:diamine N-acetyltransferase
MVQSMPTPPVIIAPAGVEDLPAIAALAGVIWRLHYPGIISAEQIDYMLAWMYSPETMRREMAQGIRYERLLVDNRLEGFSSFGPSMDSADFKLHKLYVHPQWQRRGFGERLLKSAENAARADGARRLILTVNKKNSSALAAYLKWQFKIDGAITSDIGGGFVMDDYLLVKLIQRIC